MNVIEKFIQDEKEDLKLTGSQINFSSRSTQSSVSDCVKNHRPQSAVIPYNSHNEHHVKCTRPKSAGTLNKSEKCRHRGSWSGQTTQNRDDTLKKSSMSVSYFTDSSSRLLSNLLKISSSNSSEDNIATKNDFENDFNRPSLSSPMIDPLTEDTNHQYGKIQQRTDINIKTKERNDVRNLEDIKIHSCLTEAGEEKAVKFFDNCYSMNTALKTENERRHGRDASCFATQRQRLPFCCRRRLEEKTFLSEEDKFLSSLNENVKLDKLVEKDKGVDLTKGKIENLRIIHSEDKDQISRTEKLKETEICQSKWSEKLKENLETPNNPQSSEETPPSQSISSSDNFKDCRQISENSKSEETADDSKSNQLKDGSSKHNPPWGDSTFEEIVQLLQTLEEDQDSLNLKPLKSSKAEGSMTLRTREDEFDNLNAVYSYLEEVEKDDGSSDLSTGDPENGFKTTAGFESPRLEELLNKNSVELAHEVLSLKIQMEDQKKGIKLLRETLAEMKEGRKTMELEHQEALHKASAEAEALVQRHQKFIKQLINEKKNLNETVSKLVQDLKLGEERHKRNMKSMEEKHLIEVKRAKEVQAVADKIKREKWMEIKTQKIKEMTVKGLEPELSRMAVRQQEEMTELRNLHRAELEAVELRAARRTSELMDQLRAELTKEKEQAITKETVALRASMERDFEEERNKMHSQCQMLKDQIRREEQKLANREIELQQKLVDCKREAEKEQQRIASDFLEKMEEIRRRHSIELKNLRESLEEEKEIWKNNYKKQQSSIFVEREAELHQQYKKERDREIEIIIEALEKESSKAQMELNAAAENKLKRLKEKFESDLKEAESSEAAIKSKLSETKSLLLEKEDVITELNSQIRQCQLENAFLQKSTEEMRLERANLKEVIGEEFQGKMTEMEKEKQNLEREISLLKETHLKELARKDQLNVEVREEMQKEVTKVYGRIKTAVSKKEKIIETLREEIKASNQRCEHLELLLERQRRNLLL